MASLDPPVMFENQHLKHDVSRQIEMIDSNEAKAQKVKQAIVTHRGTVAKTLSGKWMRIQHKSRVSDCLALMLFSASPCLCGTLARSLCSGL